MYFLPAPHQRLLTPAIALCAFVLLASHPHAMARAQSDACAGSSSAFAEAERLRIRGETAGLKEAVKKYREAQACYGASGIKGDEARAFEKIGDVLFSLSEYAEALPAYEEAARLRSSLSDRAAEAWVTADLGTVTAYLGMNERAEAYCRRAVSLGRESGDKRAQAHALNSLGLSEYLRGELRQALDTFERTLSLARETGSWEEEAQALLHLGWVHQETNDIERALEDYGRALTLWRVLKQRRGEVKALTGLGLAYIVLGESQKALACLDGQALPALREMGDRVGEAAAHNNLGYLFRTLGDNRVALKHHSRALEIFKRVNLLIGQAVTAQYVGYCYEVLGYEREAVSYYEQALAAARAINNPLIEADTLNSIGILKLSSGEHQAAYKHFWRALELHQKEGQLRGQAVALSSLGRYFELTGDRQQALHHYERAHALNLAMGDRLEESYALYHIAKIELALGRVEEACAHIESALRIGESLRAKVFGQHSRSSYFASVHRQFELYVEALMRRHALSPGGGYEAAAFEASERGRARALLEAVAEARLNIRQGIDPELLRRERELQRRLKAKAERRIQMGSGKASAQELAALDEELDTLTTEYQRVQGQIRASSPRYAALVQPAPLTLNEIQQRVLDADTVLLEYSLGEERSFVWAVTPDSIKSFELPARAEVEKAARRVYELLTVRNRLVKGESGQQWQARVRQADGEYADAAAALGRMLLGPVAAEMGRKRLVVVAESALQYVPFAALPVPDGAAPAKGRPESAGGRGAADPASVAAAPLARPDYTPLIVEHELVSLPSASVLALLREELRGRRRAPKSVAVLADPVFDKDDNRLAAVKATRAGGQGGARPRLGEADAAAGDDAPGAAIGRQAPRSFDGLDEGAGLARLMFSQREAKAIMASVPTGDGMLALGFRASRATAMSPELAQYRIVHFATHSLLNSEHPELSGVVLSLYDEAGKSQDGFLQLHEVYNLNLPAHLIVLSACQTALGKDVKGEGLVGLTRGFMYAGAPRVAASLWKVDDGATAELMGEFYRAMFSEGMRPAAALRIAQVRMWQQNRWRSPYYWAAFTLQGEWR